MKRPKTIMVENTVPHLLEALWNNADLPEWLRSLIFEGIQNRRDGRAAYSAAFWASQIDDCRPDEIEYYDLEGVVMTAEEAQTRDPSTVLVFPRPRTAVNS